MSWLITWDVSPVALSTPVGSIYWYGVLFAFGVFLSCYLFERQFKDEVPQSVLDKILLASVVGMILGAKGGYLLFYTPPQKWFTTVFALRGLSFHGGLIGLMLGLRWAAARYSISFWAMADALCCCAPWGLLFGRLGNFINSELFGRPTWQPWGVIFARTDAQLLPRHPSQLYEAAGEGLFLGLLLAALPDKWRRRDGFPSAVFLLVYGLLRCLIEEFRQPDPQLGLLGSGWTMGQILSSVMIITGLLMLLSSLLSSQGPRSLPIFDRSKEMICALRVKKV